MPIALLIGAAALGTLGAGYGLANAQKGSVTVNNALIDGSTAILLLGTAGVAGYFALKAKKAA